MGTNSSKTAQTEQSNTYTQVTIKDLNNLVYNNKLKTEKEQNEKTQEINLEKEENMQKTKEYLYKIDVGKLLVNSANIGRKYTIIIREGYYGKKNIKDTQYEYSTTNSISYYFFTMHVTKENLDSLLEEYKTFVTDILKLNVKISVDKTDANNYYFKASWE